MTDAEWRRFAEVGGLNQFTRKPAPQSLECSWCGVYEPILKGILYPVNQYKNGPYHEPCKETSDAYGKVRDAISALPRGIAAEIEDLVREDFQRKIEEDANALSSRRLRNLPRQGRRRTYGSGADR